MSTMIITENELRKYLYNSFLKKEMSSVFQKKNIKSLKHKNSLLKEVSIAEPSVPNALITVYLKISAQKNFATFFNDIKATDLNSTGTIKNPATINDIKKVVLASEDPSSSTPNEMTVKIKSYLEQSIIDKISFGLSGDEFLKIPVKISSSIYSQIAPDTEIELGTEYQSGSNEQALHYLFLTAYDLMKIAPDFKIKFKYGLNFESLSTWFTEEHENYIVDLSDSELRLPQAYFSNVNVFCNKLVKYVEIFQKVFNTLTMNAELETNAKLIESELSPEQRDKAQNLARFSEYLQNDRKATTMMAWDTDQSFFNIFFLENPGVQGILDLTNIAASIFAFIGKRSAIWVEVAVSALSAINRGRYLNYLADEKARLIAIKEAIESNDTGAIAAKQAEIDVLYSKLSMAKVNIDSIDDLIQAIDDVQFWEGVYTGLDLLGPLAGLSAFAKAWLFKLCDNSFADRAIKFHVPVKPQLDKAGNPVFKKVPVKDANGKPVLNPDGTPQMRDVQQYEPVNPKVGQKTFDESQVEIKAKPGLNGDDEYYAVLNCVNPDSDLVFKASIDDQLELAEDFFNKNYVKLSEVKTRQVPRTDGNGNPVKDAKGNILYDDIQEDGITELAREYENFKKVKSGQTVYLTSLDLKLAEGDECLALFRLLGIASDPLLMKHLDAFSGQGLKNLNDILNKIPFNTLDNIQGALTDSQKIVVNYILKEYPMSIDIAGNVYSFSKLEDLEKFAQLNAKNPTNLQAFKLNLNKNFDPKLIRERITKELDSIVDKAPKRGDAKYLDAAGKYTDEGATLYANDVKSYLTNVKKLRITKMDQMYDNLLQAQPATLQKFLSDEGGRKILEILKNLDGQLVAGNFDFDDNSLIKIFQLLKEYNARNQLYFMNVRLGQYGKLNSTAGEILKADVVEDLLNKNAFGLDPQVAKTDVQAPIGDVGDTANKNLANYKDQIDQQVQQKFNTKAGDADSNLLDRTKSALGGDDEFITDVYQYNTQSKGRINPDELGNVAKTFEKTNVNLVEAMQEWNKGINAQVEALNKLEGELANVGQVMSSLSGTELKLLEDLKSYVKGYKQDLLDYKSASEGASFYSSKGLQRSEFTYSAATTAKFQQALFGSTGSGTSGLFRNPFDLSNRQLLMFSGVVNSIKVLRATADSTGRYFLNAGHWRTSRLFLGKTKSFFVDFFNEVLSIGLLGEKITPASLIKGEGVLNRLKKLENSVMSLLKGEIGVSVAGIVNSNKYMKGLLRVVGVMINLAISPITVYIKHPVLASNVIQVWRDNAMLEDIIASNNFRLASELKIKEQIALYSTLIPKLTAAIIFNGRKAQISQLQNIMTSGLSNYYISHLKVLNSFKKSMEKNLNEAVSEDQKKFLENPEKNIQLTQSATDPKDPNKITKTLNKSSLAVINKMLQENGIVLRSGRYLNSKDPEIADYEKFLKTYTDGLDGKPEYLIRQMSYGNKYTLIPSDDTSAINQGSAEPDVATFLAAIGYKNKNSAVNWEKFRAIVAACILKLNLSESETESGSLFRDSYEDLINEVLKSGGNSSIEKRINNAYKAGTNAYDIIDSIFSKGFFYENESRTYALSDLFKTSAAQGITNPNSPVSIFYNELLKHITAMQKKKSSVISSEIFTIDLNVVQTETIDSKDGSGKTVKIKKTTDVVKQIGLLELIKDSMPYVSSVYKNSNNRLANINAFVRSIKEINNVKLEQLSTEFDFNALSLIQIFKNKINNNQNKFVESLYFLDFINLLKNNKSAVDGGISFYDAILDNEFLKILDNIINYYNKDVISLTANTQQTIYNFDIKKTNIQAIQDIVNNSSKTNNKDHWIYQIDELWSRQKVAILNEILQSIWLESFMTKQEYPVSNRAANDSMYYVDATESGKRKLLKFLKVLRLVCVVKKADKLFESIRSSFKIDNKNFLDITSIVCGGISSFDITDRKLSGYKPGRNTEAQNQSNYFNNIKTVLQSSSTQSQPIPKKAISVNNDYVDVEPEFLIETYLNPETGFENMISTQTKSLADIAQKDDDYLVVETKSSWLIKQTAEEIINLEQLQKNAKKDFEFMYGFYKKIWSDYSPLSDDTTAKLNPSLDKAPTFEYPKENISDNNTRNKNKPFLFEAIEEEGIIKKTDASTSNENNPNNPDNPNNNQNLVKFLNSDEQKNQSKKKKNIKVSKETIDELRINFIMQSEENREYLFSYLKNTSKYDVNYSLGNILKEESIENVFKNIAAVKELFNRFKISALGNYINLFNKAESKKVDILNNFKKIDADKLEKIRNEDFFKISILEYCENMKEYANDKKEKGLDSDFYKNFNKIKDQIFALNPKVDPSKIKSFDIQKNQRSIIIAQYFNKKINEIIESTKDNEKIDIDRINNDIYQKISNLYKNADDEDVKKEGQNYLEFLKSIIQREFTEINVNSNIIGYELNDETQNIQKLVLLGDIQKLVTEQFDNEFFINLPIIYEINLESVYQKDPNFSFKVENLKKKTTNLKQDSFNYDYYQIIDDTKTLAQALVKNKVLTMEFVGKIFEV